MGLAIGPSRSVVSKPECVTSESDDSDSDDDDDDDVNDDPTPNVKG